MPDPYRSLRMRNIFNPNNPSISNTRIMPYGDEPLFGLPSTQESNPEEEEEGNIYNPDTRATDKFMELINNIPQRQEPGFGRKVLAGLTSLGPEGQQGAERVKYGSYGRNVADFKLKADLLKDLASEERAGNINERMLMSQILRSEDTDKRLAIQERAQQERERAGEASRQVANIRTRLMQIKEDKTLSDEQKLVLGNKYSQDLIRLRGEIESGHIGERGDIDAALEGLRQEGRIALEGVEQTGRKEIESVKSSAEGELPTQTKVRQYNTARKILNENPIFKKYIILG